MLLLVHDRGRIFNPKFPSNAAKIPMKRFLFYENSWSNRSNLYLCSLFFDISIDPEARNIIRTFLCLKVCVIRLMNFVNWDGVVIGRNLYYDRSIGFADTQYFEIGLESADGTTTKWDKWPPRITTRKIGIEICLFQALKL